jgi:general secretion pathway protein I
MKSDFIAPATKSLPQAQNHLAQSRAGVSLLEAILALAILGGSLAILSQIFQNGADAGIEATELASCRMVAVRRMNELMLDVDGGIAPVTAMELPIEDFENDSTRTLVHDVEVVPGSMLGILSVRVTVRSYQDDVATIRALYSLTRWIVDPALGLEAAEAEMKAATEVEAAPQ